MLLPEWYHLIWLTNNEAGIVEQNAQTRPNLLKCANAIVYLKGYWGEWFSVHVDLVKLFAMNVSIAALEWTYIWQQKTSQDNFVTVKSHSFNVLNNCYSCLEMCTSKCSRIKCHWHICWWCIKISCVKLSNFGENYFYSFLSLYVRFGQRKVSMSIW